MTGENDAGESIRDALHVMFRLLTDDLIQRLRSGEATPTEKSIARQMLRDNGVNAVPADPGPDDSMEQLGKAVAAFGPVPFPAAPGEDDGDGDE